MLNGPPRVPPLRTSRPKISTAFSQAKELQRLLAESAAELKADVTRTKDKDVRSRLVSGIAAASRAWCDLEERKRVLSMKGLPKSVDVAKMKEARLAARRAARHGHEPSFVEPESQTPKPAETTPQPDRAAA